MREEVVELFTSAREHDFQNIEYQFHSTVENGYGRIETRRYWTMGNTEYLTGAEKWANLKSIGMVESQRKTNDSISIERRYYILSIDSNIQRFAESVRKLSCYSSCCF